MLDNGKDLLRLPQALFQPFLASANGLRRVETGPGGNRTRGGARQTVISFFSRLSLLEFHLYAFSLCHLQIA